MNIEMRHSITVESKKMEEKKEVVISLLWKSWVFSDRGNLNWKRS